MMFDSKRVIAGFPHVPFPVAKLPYTVSRVLILKHLFSCLLLLVFLSETIAQCSIKAPTIGCKNELIQFDFTTSGNDSSVVWDFGDGNSSTQSKPVYQYNSIGAMSVTLTIKLSGGGSCTAQQSIFIHAPPEPKFSISPSSSFCLNDNNIILSDSSSFGSTASRMERRLVIWGDGARSVDDSGNIGQKVNHVYQKTGKYNIDIELINDKTCKAMLSLEVDILPYYQPSFQELSRDITCDSIRICFVNDSLSPSNDLKELIWNFGGTEIKGLIDTVCHVFRKAGNYEISLTARHINGCLAKVGYNEKINLDTVILKPNMGLKRQCLGKTFVFDQPKQEGVTYYWSIIDSSANFFESSISNYFDLVLERPGKYYVKLQGVKGKCQSFYYDTVEVLGAMPIITILNGSQCYNKDTVYFKVDFITYGTNSLEFLWDFGDKYAPKCTTQMTDIVFGCNFSQQRLARHKYDSMGCYSIDFWVVDLVNGCRAVLKSTVLLSEPDTINLNYFVKRKCTGENEDYTFFFSTPQCVGTFLINFDSACGKDIFVPFKEKHNYKALCDSSRWVTVGYKLATGTPIVFRSHDSLDFYYDSGRVCYYTIWKHRWFRIDENPVAYFSLRKDSCPPAVISVIPTLEIQPLVKFVDIDWNDGSPKERITQANPLDSLGPWGHFYRRGGKFKVNVYMETDDGCYHEYKQEMLLGHYTDFVADTILCPGVDITLRDSVLYWDQTISQWRDSLRRKAGWETMQWDFGGGLSFSDLNKPLPKVSFPAPGVYVVTLVTSDSMGCRDSVSKNFHIHEVDAGIKFIDKKLVCDDIIQLFDSSTVLTTTGLDSVVGHDWDFGDLKSHSYLPNPFHYYATFGKFEITHAIKTAKGCVDTFRTSIIVDGPVPFFTIDDTLGCVPFTTGFNNISQKSTRYIWYFGDPGNNTISTASDSDVVFTYTQPGIYYIKLFAGDSVLNPNNGNKIYYCSSTFPDTTVAVVPLRRVIVLPRPAAGIDIPALWCRDQPLRLKSKSDPVYEVFNWQVNETGITSYSSDTTVNFVADSGRISIKLMPTYAKWGNYDVTCFDTTSIDIRASGILADFTFKLDSICNGIAATNNSKQAIDFLWTYSIEDQLNDSSNTKDLHLNLSPYKGMVSICLNAIDANGCKDEHCDSLGLNDIALHYNIPNVFTPNEDGFNDRYDIEIENHNYYRLSIYNRWGEIVYESLVDGTKADDINWNGMYRNGTLKLPEGAYFYIFETDHRCNPDAKRIKIHGTVTLIRGE
jgi:gliding motility-associated-like protein